MINFKNIFYSLMVLGLLLALMYWGAFIIKPLAFGAFIAILLDPIVRFVKKIVRWHSLAYAFTSLFAIIILLIPSFLITQTTLNIFSESDAKSDKIQSSVEGLLTRFQNEYLYQFIDKAMLENILADLLDKTQNFLGLFLIDGINTFINLGLALLFSYFFHAYYSESKRIIIKASDAEDKKRFKQLISRIPEVIRSYVNGLGLVMLIIGVATTLLFYAIGLDYAPFWGAVIGFMTIIPYVGSAIGILLPIAYSLLYNQSLSQIVIMLIGYAVIQQIEGNFITPKIVGDKVGVNPFIIIVSMIIMAQIWGIAGVVITIPFIAIAKIFLEEYGYTTVTKLFFESKT